jgi:predicted RNase H-like HicB family nuclease
VGGPEGASMEEALAKAQEAADKMMNELLNMDTLAPKKKRKKKKKKSKH